MQRYPPDSTFKEDKTVNVPLCVILPNSLIVKEFNILSPVLSAMYNPLITTSVFLPAVSVWLIVCLPFEKNSLKLSALELSTFTT